MRRLLHIRHENEKYFYNQQLFFFLGALYFILTNEICRDVHFVASNIRVWVGCVCNWKLVENLLNEAETTSPSHKIFSKQPKPSEIISDIKVPLEETVGDEKGKGSGSSNTNKFNVVRNTLVARNFHNNFSYRHFTSSKTRKKKAFRSNWCK